MSSNSHLPTYVQYTPPMPRAPFLVRGASVLALAAPVAVRLAGSKFPSDCADVEQALLHLTITLFAGAIAMALGAACFRGSVSAHSAKLQGRHRKNTVPATEKLNVPATLMSDATCRSKGDNLVESAVVPVRRPSLASQPSDLRRQHANKSSLNLLDKYVDSGSDAGVSLSRTASVTDVPNTGNYAALPYSWRMTPQRQKSARCLWHVGSTSGPKRKRENVPTSPDSEDMPAESSDVEVMIVEEDPVQAKHATRLLTSKGYTAVVIPSGEQLLEVLTQRAATDAAFPCVVLINYLSADGHSGSERVRAVREKFPDVALPIIMVTAEESEEVLCEALDAGCNDYICKPLNRNYLLARIRVQLELLSFWRFQVSSRRSEVLLKEILPQSVINRYVRNERIVDSLPRISVLFTEIVDFPRVERTLGCRATISLLNDMFCIFDDITDRLGVFKVETVGDSYMAMSGHDEESQFDHAKRLVALAQSMVEALSLAELKLPGTGEAVQIRVGIHTGSAYSGIVGRIRPRYCLFGDTVNTASRMKSTSFPNCVQVSDATYRQLTRSRKTSFPKANDAAGRQPEVSSPMSLSKFHNLGLRSIKGKGEMQTWLLADDTGHTRRTIAEYLPELSSRDSIKAQVSRFILPFYQKTWRFSI